MAIVVQLGIQAPDAHTLPVLLEAANIEEWTINASVAKYARYLQRQGACSYEKISKSVTAIGKLKDFYEVEFGGQTLAPGDLRNLLEDFLFAFDHGTVLGWRPASNQSYSQTRTAIFEYVKFLLDDPEIYWPAHERQFIEACRESWISAGHAKKSLLFHTKKRDRKKTAGRKRQIGGLRQYTPFPPEYVVPLIEHTVNIRDKLLFGLMAFGGRRLSEYLHLFMEDVTVRGNAVAVFLRHPTQAPMSWRSRSGATVKGHRAEYLRSEFDLLSRTEHGAKPSAVGWKGMKFDDAARMTSEVYFTQEVEAYLLALHRAYLYEVRSKVPRRRHPYYFVGLDGGPWTIRAVEKQFRLACHRLEKRYGISLAGYSPHSLRHYYGFYCADVLQSDLLMIQKWMGHTQPSSTAVYAHVSSATAADALATAEKKAKLEGRIEISAEERAAIAEEFNGKALQPVPESWRISPMGLGFLDLETLRRPML